MADAISVGHKNLSKNDIFFEIFINNKLSYMREILNFISQRTIYYIIIERIDFIMYEIYMNIGNYQGKDLSNYEVSNLGNVRNAKTKKVLKTRTQVRNDGYTAVDVTLSDTNHKQHTIVVARLVISTFKANPDNKPTVNHINEDSTDNRLNNLEWATYSENNTHNGRAKRVAKKLSIPVYCITNNIVYKSSHDAARQLNLNQGNITKCLKGKFKHTGGYQFEYYTEGDAE